MIHSFKKSLLKLSLCSISLASYCLPCHAQLSGEVDLGSGSSKSEAAPAPNIKEITVTGMGETLDAAEKQALASAIRQAVGAYMDSKTIVENEGVIQDRILSVSHAFVEKYEVVGQTKKSSDGLIEITILAKVKTNQIVQALKENNLISGEVAGQNLWAEASTKVMNAQDAVAMLEAKIPELIKSVVTITPLTENGTPKLTTDFNGKEVPSTAPASVEEDAATGEATLTWYFEMGLDKNYYNKTLLPLVLTCLDAICISNSQDVEIDLSPQRTGHAYFYGFYLYQKNNYSIPIQQTTSDFREEIGKRFIIVKDIPKLLNFAKGTIFDSSYFINCIPDQSAWKGDGVKSIDLSDFYSLAKIYLSLRDANDEILCKLEKPCWQPFVVYNGSMTMVSPFAFVQKNGGGDYIKFSYPLVQKLQTKIPIQDLKNIKKVSVDLKINNFHLKLDKQSSSSGGATFFYNVE